MKLVVDTNIIIAALIKDNISRKVLFNPNFKFLSPDYLITEILKYKDEIIDKTNISVEDFEVALIFILKNINLLPIEEYKEFLDEAKEIMGEVDKNDTPFIAAALVTKADIWSDDKHFEKQNKVKIFKTKDLIKFM